MTTASGCTDRIAPSSTSNRGPRGDPFGLSAKSISPRTDRTCSTPGPPVKRCRVEVDPPQREKGPHHLPYRVAKPRGTAVLGDPRHRPGKPGRGVAGRRAASVPGPPLRRNGEPPRPPPPQ